MPGTDRKANLPVTSRDDMAIIEPEGRIRLGHGDLALRDSIEQALATGARKILINFTKTTRMDFSCLGELSAAQKKIEDAGSKLTLQNLPSRVEEVFQLAQYGRR